ncbi:MAG TPA: sulfite exporter TauE/SafE family protein, partial [Gammaproteobacteria bacterium]|nr:sulfite exporter TauE/SafE family protein [Gammaproteobacteria bacterium]
MPDIDFLFAFLVAAAAFSSAVFHSFSGFAGGLVLAVMLAPLLGIKETVPVVATALIISNVARIWAFRKSVAIKHYLAVFLAALPFIVLSAYVYVSLPVGVVALVLGLFLLISIPLNRILKKKEVKVGYQGLALAGVPYGIVSGSTFGAAVMLAPFLIGAGLAGETMIGTIAMLGFSLNVTKTIVFGMS